MPAKTQLVLCFQLGSVWILFAINITLYFKSKIYLCIDAVNYNKFIGNTFVSLQFYQTVVYTCAVAIRLFLLWTHCAAFTRWCIVVQLSSKLYITSAEMRADILVRRTCFLLHAVSRSITLVNANNLARFLYYTWHKLMLFCPKIRLVAKLLFISPFFLVLYQYVSVSSSKLANKIGRVLRARLNYFSDRKYTYDVCFLFLMQVHTSVDKLKLYIFVYKATHCLLVLGTLKRTEAAKFVFIRAFSRNFPMCEETCLLERWIPMRFSLQHSLRRWLIHELFFSVFNRVLIRFA